VFRYLKGTLDKGLRFQAGNATELTAWVDASFGGEVVDAKSTTGYLFTYGGPIAWGSRKQKLISTSSTEAEISALMHVVKEAEWLRSVLAELVGGEPKPVQIYCDNMPAINIAYGAKAAARTMHFGVRYSSVKEAVSRGIVKVEHLAGIEMTADVFTKGLGRVLFTKFCDRIVVSI
jgi:hypothetical protein